MLIESWQVNIDKSFVVASRHPSSHLSFLLFTSQETQPNSFIELFSKHSSVGCPAIHF